MAVLDAAGKPVSFGPCWVCGDPCYSGQELVAGEQDETIRHKKCKPKRRQPEVRWG